jgi:UPF0716 protein FxsA
VLFKLLLLFTVVPVLELALLIRIGRAIDLGPTLALVVLTGVVGAALARHEGLRTLARIQEHLARGEMPARELLDGLMILIAGAFLITPGVITDCLGFLLLIPPARALLRRIVTNYVKDRVAVVPPPRAPSAAPGDEFVDVEAHEVRPPPSGERNDN